MGDEDDSARFKEVVDGIRGRGGSRREKKIAFRGKADIHVMARVRGGTRDRKKYHASRKRQPLVSGGSEVGGGGCRKGEVS